MKKFLGLLILVALFSGAAMSQTYDKVKVTLNNGLVVKGLKASIGDESISFTSDNVVKTYSLSEVSLIQATKGKAKDWALGCGGGCLGFYAVTGILAANGSLQGTGYNFNMGSYLLETVLVTGASAGIGYLIGSLLDKEEVVYHSGGKIGKLNFNISIDKLTKFDPLTTGVTVAYKF